MRWNAPTLALAITLTFMGLRSIAGAVIGLGVDESYTASISRELSLSYFDHPPLHQWITYATETVFGFGRILRAPFILMSAGTSWLMYRFTERLFGPAAGVWATLAFNVAGFFTAVSGGWILPDGPLNICLLATALAAAEIVFTEEPLTSGRLWRAWIGLGLFLGLAGLSKYQAIFFPMGLAAFFATTRIMGPKLRGAAPYVAAVVSLVIVLPVLIWNAQHGWVSFVFQGGRGAPQHGLRPWEVLTAIAGQAALLLPWVFIPLSMAALHAWRAGPKDPQRWLCLMLAAPAIIVFTLTPIWSERALPHWSMPGWLFLFPLLGEWLAERAVVTRWPRRWAVLSTAAILAIWAFAATESATGWIGAAFPRLKHDPSIEAVDWTNLREIVSARRQNDAHCFFVAAMNWRQAGKVAAAVGDLAPVRVVIGDPRGFGFLREPASLRGCDALVVGMPDTLKLNHAALGRAFRSLAPLARDHEGRGGRSEMVLEILDARGLLADLPQTLPGS